ncbi:uncharacterized protein MONOS_9670 [Monocercomonoides exilis]|uniref:uncharacterized protein n=1 Tax=Monocercomonoides exilis TaxID=2049356 RepID=UPI003559912C|nr:hypothetical protein MONOS_9670 [Monocercomonoides exilis]
MSRQEKTETSVTERFNELFDKLEHCDEDEQKQKIEEMNEMINEMNKEEFKTVFTKEMFDKVDEMIEEKKLPLENAILLLKRIGFCKVLKGINIYGFNESSLEEKFKEIIYDENEKKDEEKDEKLLVDICECYFMFDNQFSSDMYPICAPCLLNVASSKEKKEEAQKKVEVALLALSNSSTVNNVGRKLFLEKIKEIIQYHQEHCNFTQLAYQSACQFLIKRFYNDKSLEKVIVNELHFAREARRELEELTKYVDWKRTEEEKERRKGRTEENIIMRWLKTLEFFFTGCHLWNEECSGLIGGIVQLFRIAKDNHGEICYWCICSLRSAAENRNVEIEDLLKGRAVDAVLEEMQRRTVDDEITVECLQFFKHISKRLKEEVNNEAMKVKRKKTKMEIFEKLEEEGYEDTITSFHEIFYFIEENFGCDISLNISDYFVNA